MDKLGSVPVRINQRAALNVILYGNTPEMGDLRLMYDTLPGLERTCPDGTRWEIAAGYDAFIADHPPLALCA